MSFGGYWQGQQDLVRKHHKFEIGYVEFPPRRDAPPVWHGPVSRPKKPTRDVVWWRKKEITDIKTTPNRPIDQGRGPNGYFLLRLLSEPDPIARDIVSLLHVADLNSLMYTCRSFRKALTGNGAWSWMLTKLNFGDENQGAADAFKGLRSLEYRFPLWDNGSVSSILGRFNNSAILASITLDHTAINALGLKWLLRNFPRLGHISMRYCKNLRLQDIQSVLEEYSAWDSFAPVRLKETFIDYWGTPEIYMVTYLMLVDATPLVDIQHVAEKIRFIARMIRSNVFLCQRNHYDDGVIPADVVAWAKKCPPGTFDKPHTFYPCEVKDITCSMCDTSFTRRFCLKCWPTQICSYCQEFHCGNCDINSYEPRKYSGEVVPGPLLDLKTSQQCCSDIGHEFRIKHYFHQHCWPEAERVGICKGCEKFTCWTLPTLSCPHCLRRQCPDTPGYAERKCQHCGMDNSYDADVKSLSKRLSFDYLD
ncbi:hypothetical protein TWF696_006700 [Orbilia brochopaga]|uniref:F-box domain-containing protein n=1 Tax=Orbilia brochopaga TaxID=3140254 RepID=A0AAV9UTZ7_9PEZI